MKDFHYKPIPPDHSVPQHLQGEFTLELLGLSSPFTCSRKNTPQAHKLAEATPLQRALTRTRNNREHTSPPPQSKDENFGDLNTLITKNNSHNNSPIGWIYQWKAQVCVRKTRMEVVKNSRKSLLKTLDKLSFWFGNIGSKTCGENHWNRYVRLAQKLFSNLVKNTRSLVL